MRAATFFTPRSRIRVLHLSPVVQGGSPRARVVGSARGAAPPVPAVGRLIRPAASGVGARQPDGHVAPGDDASCEEDLGRPARRTAVRRMAQSADREDGLPRDQSGRVQRARGRRCVPTATLLCRWAATLRGARSSLQPRSRRAQASTGLHRRAAVPSAAILPRAPRRGRRSLRREKRPRRRPDTRACLGRFGA